MLFAAIMDAGLIPFYVFTSMVSRTEYQAPGDTQGRWTTLFGTDAATYRVVYSTFLLSVVNGGLHLISLILSIYLGVIFRKISSLPPDMNPLEDNLTSRHKRNKSSLLDNRNSQASIATTPSNTEKVDEPLISPVRNVPFMHTRNDSHSNISNVPHPNFSPRASQVDVSEKASSQSPSHRTSRTFFPNLSQQQPTVNQSTQSGIKRSPTKASSVYSTATNSTRPRSIAPSLADTNWITHPSPSPSPSPSPPRELNFLRNKQSYQPISQTSPFEYIDENEPPLLPRPLKMNPPTPPVEYQKMRKQYRQPGNESRALTPGTGNWGPGIVGIGKARQWGTSGNGGGSGGRVVSRSGVEIRDGGILPSGGVRAREVSGKVMEEGRGAGGGWR